MIKYYWLDRLKDVRSKESLGYKIGEYIVIKALRSVLL